MKKGERYIFRPAYDLLDWSIGEIYTDYTDKNYRIIEINERCVQNRSWRIVS